jgi:hypothetical protein
MRVEKEVNISSDNYLPIILPKRLSQNWEKSC